MHTRYIFVTGGVVSSLGKGIISASLGKLLQARGYRITIQKYDPYINIDPGTLNPYEHGECYVTYRPHVPTTSPQDASTRMSWSESAVADISGAPYRSSLTSPMR